LSKESVHQDATAATITQNTGRSPTVSASTKAKSIGVSLFQLASGLMRITKMQIDLVLDPVALPVLACDLRPFIAEVEAVQGSISRQAACDANRTVSGESCPLRLPYARRWPPPEGSAACLAPAKLAIG
jgi:hypothetical protein